MKNIRTLISILILNLTLVQILSSQEYLGGGNSDNIKVKVSSTLNNLDPANTINGSGLDAQLMEASRFLNQSTFGSRMDEVERVLDMGFESWIDEQISLPINFLTEAMWENWEEILERRPEQFNRHLAEILEYRQIAARAADPDSIAPPLTEEEVEEERMYFLEDVFGPYYLHFQNIWWHNMVSNEDQLRQRVAYALSQIFVVSSQSDLGDNADALTFFYDILLRHAFGNFRDLIEEVTFSPAMGYYLSHLNNSKAIPEENLHPDENYAREIMQLFTIGLYELNLDGTRKKDSYGNDIPTYTNSDIKELARVFTGLGPGKYDQRMIESGYIDSTAIPFFGVNYYEMSKQDPLVMYMGSHDVGEKNLLNGLHIPAGQHGLHDLAMVHDFLFNHPNVGPFISRQLIQRLVKSNPSPGYIERVSSVFNNNGNGIRGDLAAVVKAILLDPEARSCEEFLHFENGKLSEPFMRHAFITRMAELVPYFYKQEYSFTSYDSAGIVYDEYSEEITDPDEAIYYWNNGYEDFENFKQSPLMAPTVFNFYLPDHQPVGPLANNDLYGPEYKLHDTSTAINYLNQIYNYVGNPYWNSLWWNWEDNFNQIEPRYTRYVELYERDLEILLNQLDIEFTHGKLTDETREIIRTFDREIPSWIDATMATKYIIYLIMMSPDYTIQK